MYARPALGPLDLNISPTVCPQVLKQTFGRFDYDDFESRTEGRPKPEERALLPVPRPGGGGPWVSGSLELTKEPEILTRELREQ